MLRTPTHLYHQNLRLKHARRRECRAQGTLYTCTCSPRFRRHWGWSRNLGCLFCVAALGDNETPRTRHLPLQQCGPTTFHSAPHHVLSLLIPHLHCGEFILLTHAIRNVNNFESTLASPMSHRCPVSSTPRCRCMMSKCFEETHH